MVICATPGLLSIVLETGGFEFTARMSTDEARSLVQAINTELDHGIAAVSGLTIKNFPILSVMPVMPVMPMAIAAE
jgi:hypothetical protein